MNYHIVVIGNEAVNRIDYEGENVVTYFAPNVTLLSKSYIEACAQRYNLNGINAVLEFLGIENRINSDQAV